MKTPRTHMILVAVLAMAYALAAMPAGGATETGDEYAFKIAVERHLEERLNPVLREITGTQNLIAIVAAEISTDREAGRATARPAPLESRPTLLPGVPSRNPSAPAAADDVVVSRLRVTILLDSHISQEAVKSTIHDVAIAVIGYNPDRGDELEIRPMGFVRAGFDWSRLLQPPDLYWIVSVVLGGIFFISASLYFIRNWRVSNVSVTEMPAAQAARAELSMHSPVAAAAAAEAEGAHSADALPRPFAFVGQAAIPALAHVMRDWQAEDVALVTNYLAPELAARLMHGFHPSVQAEVAAALTIAREAGGQRVTALEDEVRSRLCFVVGGEDRVAAMLNFMDDEARDAYFDRMEATDAPAAERVKLRVRTFESLMRQASPEAVQALYRQSRPALLARVLLGVPGDVQRRVLDSLPPGASARMTEEMKFSRPLPPGRLRREKQALALLWSRMAATGEIEDEGPPLEAEQTGAGA